MNIGKVSSTGYIVPMWYQEDEPTLGVREPREPIPPTLSSGAAAQLVFEPEPEAEAIATGARMTPFDLSPGSGFPG